MSAPKHRANKLVRTEPRVQPVPRHAGDYAPEERLHERLGADAIAFHEDFGQLLNDMTVGNPFRGPVQESFR